MGIVKAGGDMGGDVVGRAARRLVVVGLVLAGTAGLGVAQDTALDTIRAGRFDFGKMWTFEYPPAEYFSTTYGFSADAAWFERIRMAALRIPGCSASFVSPHGLLATNHHCVRGSVSRVAKPGETLLDDGFFARSLDEERRIPNYYADQLIAVEDVSAEVFADLDRAATPADREVARSAVFGRIEARLRERHKDLGSQLRVQIIPLYQGGRYSAYVFRRFMDIRLVAAAELQMGFFGGDADNFTYPRHALDFAILRVYGDDGKPFETSHYFTWGSAGVEQGDAVFVIGNPGPTNRLNSMAQLEYQRDVSVPALVSVLTSRLTAMHAFYAADRATGDAIDIRNRMFGLSNSLKASVGRLAALRTPEIMARKRDAERQLRAAIAAKPALSARYGDVLDRLALLQGRKRGLAAATGAFQMMGSPAAASAFERRVVAWGAAALAQTAGLPADSVTARRAAAGAVGNLPADLERRLLEARLADFARYLGPEHAVTRAALGGRTPAAAAEALLAGSAFGDSARLAAVLAGAAMPASDPGASLAVVLGPAFGEFGGASGLLLAQERELGSDLGRVRFEVYGRDVPPDASSSPRITDGVVLPYEYNGTLAPVHTTFYGMYGLYYAHGDSSEWALPKRWLPAPAGLDLATPLNFISTADSYGGNSGSPAVTKRLELVGLNFDRNIEGMTRDFIYLPERGRNVMVDVRAIEAALDHVYDLDRIVREVRTGQLFATEQDADRAR